MDRQRLEARNISNEQLERLRQGFQVRVGSVRRLERITSVRDLLQILERQDLYDEEAMELINDIVPPEPRIERVQSGPEIPAGVNDVHELIARKIGRHWKEFARKLDVNENEIDSYDFDPDLRRDARRITLQVLIRFRQQNLFHNAHEWLFRLRKALEYARRNDIWETVEERVVHLGGAEQLRS